MDHRLELQACRLVATIGRRLRRRLLVRSLTRIPKPALKGPKRHADRVAEDVEGERGVLLVQPEHEVSKAVAVAVARRAPIHATGVLHDERQDGARELGGLIRRGEGGRPHRSPRGTHQRRQDRGQRGDELIGPALRGAGGPQDRRHRGIGQLETLRH